MMMAMAHNHQQHRHQHVMKRRSILAGSKSLAYSIYLDEESTMKLSWTPDYIRKEVHFRLEASPSAPQSWYAVGFSDRGDWAGADLCVAWEDWKGSLIVQVF